MDRVFNRAQLLERCRRIYEMDPRDPLNPSQETLDLMLSARPRPRRSVPALADVA